MIGKSGKDIRVGGKDHDDLHRNRDDDGLFGGNLFASEVSADQLKTLRHGGIPPVRRPRPLGEATADTPDPSATSQSARNLAAYGNTAAEAMIMGDDSAKDDPLAVLYDKDGAIPAITVNEANAGVFTVLADGIPVAVVASAEAAITAADVLLLERNADGSAPIRL